jgi:hypothetical protein
LRTTSAQRFCVGIPSRKALNSIHAAASVLTSPPLVASPRSRVSNWPSWALPAQDPLAGLPIQGHVAGFHALPLSFPVAKEGNSAVHAENTDLTLDELLQRLRNPDVLTRIHAAAILGSLGEQALPAVPALIDLLKAEKAQDRKLAAWTLGELGPVAEEAVPALLDAVEDENEGVSEMVFQALERIDLVPVEDEAA